MKAIIVEDEKAGMDNLVIKIKHNCPGVDIIACCPTGEDAIQKIDTLQPDLVFLDIRLGTMTGFDVLSRLKHIDFQIIFTTAYDEYALKAIKTAAIDFLLKPVDVRELIDAVAKAWRALQQKKNGNTQIALPVEKGLKIVDCNDIIWCEVNNNTSTVHLDKNLPDIQVARTLGELHLKLPRRLFFRIHRSHLINRNFVSEVTNEGFVVLAGRKSLSIAPDRKKPFMDWLGGE
jgi:two-component system LytT family response regulator